MSTDFTSRITCGPASEVISKLTSNLITNVSCDPASSSVPNVFSQRLCPAGCCNIAPKGCLGILNKKMYSSRAAPMRARRRPADRARSAVRVALAGVPGPQESRVRGGLGGRPEARPAARRPVCHRRRGVGGPTPRHLLGVLGMPWRRRLATLVDVVRGRHRGVGQPRGRATRRRVRLQQRLEAGARGQQRLALPQVLLDGDAVGRELRVRGARRVVLQLHLDVRNRPQPQPPLRKRPCGEEVVVHGEAAATDADLLATRGELGDAQLE
mmetsp:Transcript_8047/g.22968  ORF Transcript_8047/g.22968 Transcript_8047/m.22968 type:complete len:269 (-) Transcript_8047:484-1290(-)